MAPGVGGYLRQPNRYGYIASMDVRKVQARIPYMDVRTETKQKKKISEEDILVLVFIVFQFGWSLKMALGVGEYLRQPNIYGHIACMDVRKVQGADSIHECKASQRANIQGCR